MFLHSAVALVMAFPPPALPSFIGTTPPSDFLTVISCSRFIITCSTYSLPERTIRISRVAANSQCPTCHALQPRSSSIALVNRTIEWRLPGGKTCRPAYVETFEAKSLQLALTACWLAPIVLNIWSRLRLPDACYPVVDLPCRDGTSTRWNYRPGSAAPPILFLCGISNTLQNHSNSRADL